MFRSAMVASPASNGGRGLKPLLQHQRQRPKRASPASNGGRGLKLAGRHCVHQKLQGIARQQWRARIETDWMREAQAAFNASPASNGGRGLKPSSKFERQCARAASPASNGGRGLKHLF